jgi:hypothetical protein
MIAEHEPLIRAACEAAGVEPVRARTVPGTEVTPRYVVITRTAAGVLNLAAIDPDFWRSLRGFQLVEGDLDEALGKRVHEEGQVIAYAIQQSQRQPCPRHRFSTASTCQQCENEFALRGLDGFGG